jgi:hypothetical protein
MKHLSFTLLYLPFLIFPVTLVSANSVNNQIEINQNTGGNTINGQSGDTNIHTGSSSTNVNINNTNNNTSQTSQNSTSSSSIKIQTEGSGNNSVKINQNGKKIELNQNSQDTTLTTTDENGNQDTQKLNNDQQITLDKNGFHLQITKQGNQTTIIDQSTTTTSNLTLSVDPARQQIFVITPTGPKSITVYPSQIPDILKAKGINPANLSDIKLTDDNQNQPIYQFDLNLSKKFLYLIPVRIPTTIAISAETSTLLFQIPLGRRATLLSALSF